MKCAANPVIKNVCTGCAAIQTTDGRERGDAPYKVHFVSGMKD